MRAPGPEDSYDPVKAHEYYERTKKLKGRKPAAPKSSTSSRSSSSSSRSSSSANATPQHHGSPARQKAQARVGRLRSKIKSLQGALSEAEAALSAKRQAARTTAKKNSDGKTTAKEKQSSKQYRDKHKTELAAKRKANSSKSSSHSVSSMSVQELNTRVSKIRTALRDAKQQLSAANKQLGQLAHSTILAEPNVNEHFSRFQSAERIPSK